MKPSVLIRLPLLLVLAGLAIGCERDPGPLALAELYFCDDVVDDACVLRGPAGGRYAFVAPEVKRSSWHDLGYYMYFHSRQTPGLRVEFNQALAPADRQRLEKSLHCSYVIEKGELRVNGELEGRRVDDGGRGLWCFDYLGTMLIEFQKKHGDVKAAPRPDFFPITLRLQFSSDFPVIKGEKSGLISVDWTQER